MGTRISLIGHCSSELKRQLELRREHNAMLLRPGFDLDAFVGNYTSIFDRANRRFLFDLTKGKEVRYIPLSDYAFEKVDSLFRFQDQPYIFCHHAGRRQGQRWKPPDKKFRGIRRKLDMDFVTPHVLRHLTGTTWVRNGADVKAVKEKFGHKDIRTTMIYVEYNETQADKAIREAIESRRKQQDAVESVNSGGGGGKGEDLRDSKIA